MQGEEDRKEEKHGEKQVEEEAAGRSMAVEHKDDAHPVAGKLKGLQESDSGESNENGKHHTDDKENVNGNSHSDNNNNNNTDDHTDIKTTDTKNNNGNVIELDLTENNNNTNADNDNNDDDDDDSTQQAEAQIEAGIAGLAIAEPSNFAVKHPLQNGWTIWYDNPGKRTNTASWGDHLRKITTFDTVEDFWRVFNNLKPASTLPQGSNYHIFKEHIEPKWEDSANSRGGKWTVSIPPKSRGTSLDTMWLWTVLACIGETIRAPDDVCGLVVSIRKAGDRVQIWTKDAHNEVACREIGRSLKETLELSDSTIIGYQSHSDSMKKSNNKNKYEV